MDLALDTNHDLIITGRDLTPLTGSALVAQRIKQRLLLLQGEWFLDEEAGLPWFDRIFTKQQTLDGVKQLLIKEINETPGVDELQALSLELNKETRQVNCNFTVLADGEALSLIEVL